MPDEKPTTTGTAGAATQPGKAAGTATQGATGGTAGAAGAAGAVGATDDYEKKYKEEQKLRKDSDKQLQQARAAIEQHQRAQNTENENMRADMEKLQERSEDFETFKYTTFLELAVLKNTQYRWHDGAVEDVVAALDPDEVTIGDDGKVDGLEDALKRIAAAKPYLLAPAGTSMQPANQTSIVPNVQQAPQEPSGAHPGGTPGGNADFDEAFLKKKYKIA